MSLRPDIWRCALIETPVAKLAGRDNLGDVGVRWLHDEAPHRFLADPFGLWRDGTLHVFAESYDHRERHGRIECLTFDRAFRPIDRRTVLAEPWHLSYPFVFEAEGETWMLPEAFRSGRLTLYRAVDFPHRWEPATVIALDRPAIDATPLFRDGLWWLFHAAAGSARDKVSLLHLACAERLTGPWRPHPASPVRRDLASARPGGTPFEIDGRLMLPVQDCRQTYGGAIRLLEIVTLTPDRFEAVAHAGLAPSPALHPFTAGLHTLSAAGPVTLIDAKRRDGSLRGLLGAARGYLPGRRQRPERP